MAASVSEFTSPLMLNRLVDRQLSRSETAIGGESGGGRAVAAGYRFPGSPGFAVELNRHRDSADLASFRTRD